MDGLSILIIGISIILFLIVYKKWLKPLYNFLIPPLETVDREKSCKKEGCRFNYDECCPLENDIFYSEDFVGQLCIACQVFKFRHSLESVIFEDDENRNYIRVKSEED